MHRQREIKLGLAAALGFAAWPALAQMHIDIYGRLDASIAVVKGDPMSSEPLDRNTFHGMWNASRSRIGIKTTEDLGLGLKVRAVIEHSLSLRGDTYIIDPDTGQPATFADALAYVEVSHYAWGRFQVGRGPNIVRELAITSAAWGGDTLAGDPFASILSFQERLAPRRKAISYESPMFGNLTLEAQAIVGKDNWQFATTATFAAGSRSLMLGWWRGENGDWLVPIAVGWPLGLWQVSAVGSTGRSQGRNGSYAAVSFTRPWRAAEWRLGVARYQVQNDPITHKASFGFHKAFAPRLVGYLDVVGARDRAGRRRSGADVGVKLTF